MARTTLLLYPGAGTGCDHSDGMAAYEALTARGARFLTPPVTSEWEVRGFFRDPDGHLLEISEFRG